MTAQLDDLTADVREFCEREGIGSVLRLAVQLVQEFYPDVRSLHAEVVRDPDSGDAWIALTARVPLTVAELLARDEPFLVRWIAAAPWPERDRVALLVHPA